jgi:hypothetical protein
MNVSFRGRCTAMILALLLGWAGAAAAETVVIEASRDATLIEDPDGALANGSGPVFFAGRTSQADGSVRRALLHFDVAGAVPRGAIVERVTLTLFMTPSNRNEDRLALYRVLADWGEGPSAASGGGGRPAEPGDATWLHTFYDDAFWTISGGQFLGRPSAAALVAGSDFYSWSGRRLAQDVRVWAAAPHRNFGWILIGDETRPQTAKSFASREAADPAVRPVLEVTYRLPGKRR